LNQDEAKIILQLYRPGAADADDPQIAEALALAKEDPELARWLEEHRTRQHVLREKFRQIAVPAGLKEQIVSEEAARRKIILWRQNALLAAAAIIVALIALAPFWFRLHPDEDTLAVFENRMAGVALRGYSMNLETNSVAEIRAYLAQNHAPADFVLPAPLEKIALTGCAVEGWRDTHVAMICFHTGGTAAAREQSDLWLFVVDRASVKNIPATDAPQFAKVNQLATAVWTQDGKLYLLGAKGDESLIRKLL
jgi:uncharacterized membrane protein YbaN (DUF454 family)